MTGRKSGGQILGAILVLGLLAGCGGRGDTTALDLEGRSPEQIYNEGTALIEDNPERAIRYFGEIERLYPYTQYAKRGLIQQAYAYHQAKEYEDARATAQRFLDFYPADPDAAYAQYLLALSYYDQIDEVGRDQGLTFQALQALRTVMERYPDSEYARTASLQFDIAFDHLASKEMEIGRYYLKRQNYTAAINRFRAVVEQYQTTSHTPEALHRLVESYLALGLTAEAQTAGAILGYNYRSSPFYDDSFRLLTGRGLDPKVTGDNWLASIYRQTIRGEWL
ncbi:outer membrane protein assembly factor BamD [Falsirhodobacter halotolerans]|uniref:outer membrane protein assembly factor BamD n=1 Tax=Falsirhodobacter halotolerans TaxID=1146892 RepID=UPI001FD05727|nr:outer membrane protein assembly factor BamD [Falsirhodobacter halotolerans]MCJ8140296.1 outer membrane protein assembly factor BamD [Falsirhodobacter halotolerans]